MRNKIKRLILGLSGYVIAATFGLITLAYGDQVGALITAHSNAIVFALKWITFIVFVALFGAAFSAILNRVFR